MKIYALNTLQYGVDILNHIKSDIKISGIIGLDRRKKNDKISGYTYMKNFCSINNFDFVPIKNYSMKNRNDKLKLLALDIDILLVLGWQRLIPEWLLNKVKKAAIGSHGSPWGINNGRGRSPQNWSLILGKKQFEISLFKIDKGIDSGGIIDTRKFNLTDFDDIKTSYQKCSLLISQMLIENIKKNKKIISKPQKGSPRYLPKRIPEDGQIDWNRTTYEIYNFVRALTRPYPGAFSFILKNKITIWKSFPFNLQIGENKVESGKIIKIFSNNYLLIKTKGGYLLVTEYSIQPSKFILKEGMKLDSCNFSAQIQSIIDRHYSKYPNNIIHKEISRLCD